MHCTRVVNERVGCIDYVDAKGQARLASFGPLIISPVRSSGVSDIVDVPHAAAHKLQSPCS